MNTLTKSACALFLPLLIFAAMSLRIQGAAKAGNGDSRTPVLIELFTSEGCSDCPPADDLLKELDNSQPVPKAQLIVLSEHVDYWDRLGWKDPYSSSECTERQRAYVRQFGLRTVYTPEMVVDGEVEFAGGNPRKALQAIQDATKTEKIPVTISGVHLDGEKAVGLHVEVGPPPSSVTVKHASVLIAAADDSDQSHVSHGENQGRTLTHVAVVRNLTQVGTLDRAGKFSREVKVSLNHANPHNLRVVAIVQDSQAWKVLGTAATRLSN